MYDYEVTAALSHTRTLNRMSQTIIAVGVKISKGGLIVYIYEVTAAKVLFTHYYT